MSKPAMKKGKARSAENGVDESETVDHDGHRQGYEEAESTSSQHHHHHQRELAGGPTASPQDVRRTRKEVRLEREGEREKGDVAATPGMHSYYY